MSDTSPTKGKPVAATKTAGGMRIARKADKPHVAKKDDTLVAQTALATGLSSPGAVVGKSIENPSFVDGGKTGGSLPAEVQKKKLYHDTRPTHEKPVKHGISVKSTRTVGQPKKFS